MFIIAISSDWIFSTAKVKSSACWMYLISMDILIFTPLIRLSPFSSKASISATNIYNRADIGHLCLIPLDVEHVLEIQPFFLILKICFVYNIFIHLISIC